MLSLVSLVSLSATPLELFGIQFLERAVGTLRPNQIIHYSVRVSLPFRMAKHWLETYDDHSLECFHRFLPSFAAYYSNLRIEAGCQEESWTLYSSGLGSFVRRPSSSTSVIEF